MEIIFYVRLKQKIVLNVMKQAKYNLISHQFLGLCTMCEGFIPPLNGKCNCDDGY